MGHDVYPNALFHMNCLYTYVSLSGVIRSYSTPAKMYAKKIPFLLPFAGALKIFVYDDTVVGLQSFLSNSEECKNFVFGTEVILPEIFANSTSVATLSELDADLFYVPLNIACTYYSSSTANSSAMDEALLSDMGFALDLILDSLPYFEQRDGRNHVFNLFFKGLFPGWRAKLRNSIILTPETEVEFEISSSYFPEAHRVGMAFPPFNSRRDIVIPPFMNIKQLEYLASHAQPSDQSRMWLVSFFGKRWVDVNEGFWVRERMMSLFDNVKDAYIHAVDTIRDFRPLSIVAEIMGRSKFCLVPRGRSAWTTRLYDAWWAGCVPVVLSDHFVLPYRHWVDPTTVLIQWPTAAIDTSLVKFLRSISEERIQQFRRAAERIRCMFVYPNDSQFCLNQASAISALTAQLELYAREHEE